MGDKKTLFDSFEDDDLRWYDRGRFDGRPYTGRPYSDSADALRIVQRSLVNLENRFEQLSRGIDAALQSLHRQVREATQRMEELAKIVTPTPLQLRHSLDDIMEKTDADGPGVSG